VFLWSPDTSGACDSILRHVRICAAVQRFVELVRRGTEADRDAALDCLRTALAPCALDAYPVSAAVVTLLLTPECLTIKLRCSSVKLIYSMQVVDYVL
jgi:hypothetical protein